MTGELSLRRRRVRRARSAWSRREETTTRPPLAPFAPERPTFAPQPPESSHTATIQVTRHNGRSLWYILPDWMCMLVNICKLFRVWVIPSMDQCETGDDSGYLSAVGGRFARVRITSILFPSSLHCLNDPLSKIRGVIKPPPRATDSSSAYNSCTFNIDCKRF